MTKEINIFTNPLPTAEIEKKNETIYSFETVRDAFKFFVMIRVGEEIRKTMFDFIKQTYSV